MPKIIPRYVKIADSQPYPSLRFPDFNKDWTKRKLGNIVSFKRTNSFSRADLNYENGYLKNIHYGDIHTNFDIYFDIDNERVPFINSDISLKNISEEDYCKEGDLVIADASEDFEGIGAAIEIVNTSGNRIVAGLHTYLIRPKANIFSKGFLGSLMQSNSIRLQIKILAQGTKVLGISTGSLRKVIIKYPELTEQQKIADFLSSVDQKIQQLRRKKELLKEYKKGLMQKLFSQEIRFKSKTGENFPDWEYKELGDISDRITDKNEYEEYDLVLTNSAVQGVVSQTEYFDKSIANKSNLGGYYIVKKDDFVYNPRISSEAPVGPIKRNKLKTGVMSPLYSVFRINKKNLDFFEYFFESTLWHRYMHSVANFGARHDRMNITVGDFQKLPIPLPSEAERKRITDFINSVSKKLITVNRKLKLSEKFKKGLLQQMFV